MLNDEDGCLLDVIENDCLQKCERIIRKILSKWIQGRGKPVTWSALIEVLRRCNLNELADHIHEKMQSLTRTPRNKVVSPTDRFILYI